MPKGFTFKLNSMAVKKLDNATIKAIQSTGEKMLAEKVAQNQIPFLEGTLQNVQSRVDLSELKKGNLKIEHDTPYAQRLYYHPEYNFTKEFNAAARGEWWEDYITGNRKDRPKQLFERYLKKYSGGTIT